MSRWGYHLLWIFLVVGIVVGMLAGQLSYMSGWHPLPCASYHGNLTCGFSDRLRR